MDLRHRLLIAFLIIIMLPCCMIGAIGTVIFSNQIKSMSAYGVETDTWQVIGEPIQILNRMTRSTFNELCTIAERYPERMENETLLDSYNNTLMQRLSFLIVKRKGEIKYVGDADMFANVADRIPENSGFDAAYDGGVYVGGTIPFLVKQQTFCFSNGEEGCFYIITDVNTLVGQLRDAMVQAVFFSILAIVLTASVLVAWLYQGIIKPLSVLRKATQQLQEGNLDYHLESVSDDEIGQLCSDFEEMRIHLKEQIEVRIQYEQELKELISNISHDLKTPLTAIKGYAEGLIDGVADTPEKQQKYLRTIYSKANDMTTLVEELSFYSKIDTNNMPYHFEQVLVNDYFRDCMEECRAELEIKHFAVEFSTNVEDTVYVTADREQLKRVMNNIIGNSAKYSKPEEENKIAVRILEEAKFVRVEVEDNGQGISQTDLQHIFERFYRADHSRNSKQGGTGLGLAIVKKIIEEHGGTIHAESEEGKGTMISFTLRKTELTEKEGV